MYNILFQDMLYKTQGNLNRMIQKDNNLNCTLCKLILKYKLSKPLCILCMSYLLDKILSHSICTLQKHNLCMMKGSQRIFCLLNNSYPYKLNSHLRYNLGNKNHSIFFQPLNILPYMCHKLKICMKHNFQGS